jgi:glycosyltransferase involved in cell wall biosynthesis
MPTRNRPHFAQSAIQCFLKQTYLNKELVILDDLDAPSFNDANWVGTVWPHVRYEQLPTRLTIAEKRNACCQLASGDVIIHWDDDDWSAPSRLSDQMELLSQNLVDVVGYNSILFYDERTGQSYRFERERGYAIGTSLCYRKSFWQLHPFQEGSEKKPWGEDNGFVWEAKQRQTIDTVDGRDMIVARMHHGMTAPKEIRQPCDVAYGSWRSVSLEQLPKGFHGTASRIAG